MFYNPYFKQMLNPAYLDVLDCPYLNYTKNREESSIGSKKLDVTVPEENVSNFVDALKLDLESLPKATKDEYYYKLAELLQNKQSVEKFEDSSPINTAYPHEFALYIFYFLTITGIVVYYLNVKSMGERGLFYLAIYLIILVIGFGAYHFSYI